MPDRERKLTKDKRETLLLRWSEGVSQAELAEAFDIAQSSVSYLVRRYVGAEPGRRVQRMMPGVTLNEARKRVEEEIDDLEVMLKRWKQLHALLGAIPTVEPEEKKLKTPWDRANVLAMNGEDAQFVNGLIYFNGDALDLEEFWRRHPRGIAKDAASERLLTYEEAVDLRAELEEDFTHQRSRLRESSPPEEEDEARSPYDAAFYRKALRALS